MYKSKIISYESVTSPGSPLIPVTSFCNRTLCANNSGGQMPAVHLSGIL